MRIKTLLLISALSLFAFTILIGTVTYVATRQTDRISAQGSLAERLMEDIFGLHVLTQTYVVRFEERPKVQWYRQYDLIEGHLGSELFEDEPSSAYLGALRADLHDIRDTFDELVARHEGATPSPAIEQQLGGDLLVKTQRIISDAHDMADAAFTERAVARARHDRMVFTLLVVLTLASAVLLILLYGHIARPLVKLQQGAEKVGEGDLGYKVGIGAKDEVGKLSRAFDEMSARLKRSYEGLETKVQERTRELDELNAKNETLLESIGDGVAAIDNDWRVILWNASAVRITGWSKEEALGSQLRDVLPFIRERDRAENLLFISEAMLSGKVKLMENHTVLIRKDKSEIPVADSASPIVDSSGLVKGAIIIFRDSTMERDANLVRSSFAYASHQLRTPVIKALWGLEAALEEKDPAKMREKVQASHSSMKSIHKLVSEIVEVSEIDQHVILPKRKKAKVGDIVSGAVRSASAKAEAKGVRIAQSPIDGAIGISTDASMLGRALQEIIDNAVEYGPRGTEMAVSAEMVGPDAVIEVRDGGIGIPVEQQGLIFTKFFRGQNIPEESVGAGLGLYICSEYVKLLGGKVWFKSEPGKGTSFFISVPAATRS